MYQPRKPHLTEDGILRCPCAADDCFHEFRFSDGRVLYRQTTNAGDPLGKYADWSGLSDARIVDQYFAGGGALKQWFHEHGFERERIDQLRAQEEANEKARRSKKRRSR